MATMIEHALRDTNPDVYPIPATPHTSPLRGLAIGIILGLAAWIAAGWAVWLLAV